jgi:RNA polymerase sigma-70 factor (ECF subfamily)
MEELSLACIRDAQQDDLLAMSQVVEGLAPWVGRLCGPIALDPGSDATQEMLIQVLGDLPALRDPLLLRAWVRRIATRESIRHAKRARRDQGHPLPTHRPAPGDVSLVRDVRRVLAALSPEQRAVLVLRDLEGYSEDEAAALLQVARGTVKSPLHRAPHAFQKRGST